MDITVKPVCTKRDLRKFIHLPAKIHNGHENWIPPLYFDCNFEYVIGHLKALGFEKEIDLVVYQIRIPEKTPELYREIAERSERNNPEIQLLEFTSRKDLKPFIRPVFTLINDTILGSAMLDSARRGRMEYIDSHLEMESNTKVRAEMEYMGGEIYKTYRVFGKSLCG